MRVKRAERRLNLTDYKPGQASKVAIAQIVAISASAQMVAGRLVLTVCKAQAK